MRNLPEHVKVCIELCRQCRNICQDTFYNHCLDQGCKHVSRDHVLRAMSGMDMPLRQPQNDIWAKPLAEVVG